MKREEGQLISHSICHVHLSDPKEFATITPKTSLAKSHDQKHSPSKAVQAKKENQCVYSHSRLISQQ
jgi:hypothetical protein